MDAENDELYRITNSAGKRCFSQSRVIPLYMPWSVKHKHIAYQERNAVLGSELLRLIENAP